MQALLAVSRAIDWILNQLATELGVAKGAGPGTSAPVMLSPGVR